MASRLHGGPSAAELELPIHAGNISAMNKSEANYPDISDILNRKAEGRRAIARRSFGEKIAMMESLRERLAPFKRAREQRRAAKPARGPDGDRTAIGSRSSADRLFTAWRRSINPAASRSATLPLIRGASRQSNFKPNSEMTCSAEW